MEKTGVREISRKTGYSPATVSNVLNNKTGVSRKAIDAVMAAARELGLEHDEPTRQITFVLGRKTGRVIDQEDFHPIVVEGVRREAEARGLDVVYASVDLAQPERAEKQVEELFSNPNAAVLLYAAEMEEADYRLFEPYADRLVVVEGWSELLPFECVVTANEASAYRATSMLVDRGFRRIGYLASDTRLRGYITRERGYRRALGAAGLSYDDGLRIVASPGIGEARADVLAWLRGHRELPDALFCDCDRLAVGAMRAFSECGIAVPDDISIVGFEGVLAANFVSPQLTTMYVPKAEIGELAACKLIEGMGSKRDFCTTTLVGASLAERGTVRS